ncbi:MAG: HAD family hydrolase [Lachnospiraceae bacterium]|nr:HAD family hydrolase [Lachnospiraceae bacterium]
MKKNGIIFDMDGTLWDSAAAVADSWTEILKDWPKDPGRRQITAEEISSVMGQTMTAISAKLFPALDEEGQSALGNACMEYENDYLRKHGGMLYPHLRETLEKLAETYPLYIVSNCQQGYIEAFLEYHKLGDLFLDHLCWGDTGLEKDGTMTMMVQRHDLDRWYYVGDIEADYRSTKKAGGIFIHAGYGFGEVPEAPYRINAIDELPSLMERL